LSGCTGGASNKCAKYSECPSSSTKSAPGGAHSDFVTYSDTAGASPFTAGATAGAGMGGINGQGCYDGSGYATQACANCTGPGPSQCTACLEGNALVSWRSEGREGTCQPYTDTIQVREMPGVGSEAAALMPSFLSKWGLQSATVSLPAVASIATTSLDVDLTCYLRKSLGCKGRSDTSEDLDCTVDKEAKLKSVNVLQTPGVDIEAECLSAGGQRYVSANGAESGPHKCASVEVHNLHLLVAQASPHDACAGLLKLL